MKKSYVDPSHIQTTTCSRFYHGGSMAGTFRPGDCLVVRLVIWEQIRAGDVVVFRGHNEENNEIVHRVLSVRSGGLLTQGDANPLPDPDLVIREDLVGVVSGYERAGRFHAVQGGWRGLMKVSWLRLMQIIRRAFIPILRPFYRLLRKLGWVGFFWKPELTEIHLETANGPLVKYIYRRRTVAQYWRKSGYFEAHKPYDLVIRRPDKED
jgi:signal peptidase I